MPFVTYAGMRAALAATISAAAAAASVAAATADDSAQCHTVAPSQVSKAYVAVLPVTRWHIYKGAGGSGAQALCCTSSPCKVRFADDVGKDLAQVFVYPSEDESSRHGAVAPL
ncbi:hypothetical protein JKP88DRAFT_278869 [Tribonema minus]|uniref:Uncharacterized protein n=1 Tax=Tribonema minus TaxID=303371 RepID=A0A835Z1X5_9STRA|nr:hypothetical protein JKP88DRAFT_278869 [Tribonema minus]